MPSFNPVDTTQSETARSRQCSGTKPMSPTLIEQAPKQDIKVVLLGAFERYALKALMCRGFRRAGQLCFEATRRSDGRQDIAPEAILELSASNLVPSKLNQAYRHWLFYPVEEVFRRKRRLGRDENSQLARVRLDSGLKCFEQPLMNAQG